jgi:uncharacterized protein
VVVGWQGCAFFFFFFAAELAMLVVETFPFMKFSLKVTRTVVLSGFALMMLAGGLAGAAQPAKKVLFFSKSSGFEHSAIKHADGRLSAAEQVLQELGQKSHIEFTFTKDGSIFTAENIAKYDAFAFYTTGDLTKSGTDKQPPMSPEGKAAFLRAIEQGKGFVGMHSATDTFHSPSADKLDPYIQMIGGEFIVHGGQQKARMICADKKFPGQAAVPADFGPLEEWYALKWFAPNLHVLLIQDTSGMETNGGNHCYARPPYPATWARMHGKGRVFYTSMGHREDVWTNPVFQQVLLGGINWAVRNVKADVTPNLDKVTPQANVLP